MLEQTAGREHWGFPHLVGPSRFVRCARRGAEWKWGTGCKRPSRRAPRRCAAPTTAARPCGRRQCECIVLPVRRGWRRGLCATGKPGSLGDPERPRPSEPHCWDDLHSFRMPGTTSLERALPIPAAGRRPQGAVCRTCNFLLAVLEIRKRSPDERAPLPHGVPTALDAAPVGFVLADVSGNVSGHGISGASRSIGSDLERSNRAESRQGVTRGKKAAQRES